MGRRDWVGEGGEVGGGGGWGGRGGGGPTGLLPRAMVMSSKRTSVTWTLKKRLRQYRRLYISSMMQDLVRAYNESRAYKNSWRTLFIRLWFFLRCRLLIVN